jgi:hypothetical protein
LNLAEDLAVAEAVEAPSAEPPVSARRSTLPLQCTNAVWPERRSVVLKHRSGATRGEIVWRFRAMIAGVRLDIPIVVHVLIDLVGLSDGFHSHGRRA